MKEMNLSKHKFLCNPDVVLREEDETGALLFNPDTNQVKVINTTGLFIWKLFSEGNALSNVIEAVLESFEDVPLEAVQKDIEEFINLMLSQGFIGVVEEYES